MKTYTDGYRDALLDLRFEINDNPFTLHDVKILIDELIADLAAL